MASGLKRYEAAVKLDTGEVVSYHNINTGLFKFHRFLCDQFSSNQKWLYYKVRRKKTKEIVGYYRNFVPAKRFDVVEIETEMIENPTRTGIFISIPFLRNKYKISRNIFVSNTQIIENKDGKIKIPEWLYKKAIETAQEDLFQYFTEQNHQIMKNEISVGDINIERKIIIKDGRKQEEPIEDYP